jgi:hypothetical protein
MFKHHRLLYERICMPSILNKYTLKTNKMTQYNAKNEKTLRYAKQIQNNIFSFETLVI